MVFYPITLFITDFPVIITRMLQIFMINIETFTEISYYLLSLAGLFNALIYGVFSTLHLSPIFQTQSKI
jgi:hypothetical protein